MIHKKSVGILLGGLLSTFPPLAFSEEDMRWFKNEIVCADTKVTIRSYCRNEGEQPVNSLCTKQTLILEKLDGTKTSRNLLDKEPSRGGFHAVGLIRCVKSENKHYLNLTLDNGGNCSTCELDAVTDLNGKWKRYGQRWYASASERDDIAKHEQGWLKQEPFLLKNKIAD